jgi:hypothetical protein
MKGLARIITREGCCSIINAVQEEVSKTPGAYSILTMAAYYDAEVFQDSLITKPAT